MQETPQQYIQRMLGYVAGQDPLKVWKATPKKIERLISGVPLKRLRTRPAPGKWSVAEIVAHLSETELVGGYRIRTMLGASGTNIQAFDQDIWAVEGNYSSRNPQHSLELFKALRKANLALLEGLSSDKWERYGMHQERGKESIAHTVRMLAGHDLNHLAQIERILAQPGGRQKSKRK